LNDSEQLEKLKRTVTEQYGYRFLHSIISRKGGGNMSSNRNNNRYRNMFFLIVVTIIICILCWRWLIKAAEHITDDTITEMSCIYLQELTVQKTSIMQTILDNQFAQIQTVATAVSKDDLDSEEHLFEFLKKIQESNDFSFVAFLDNEGYYYCSDGKFPVASKINSIGELISGDGRLISVNETLLDDNMLLLGEVIPEISYMNVNFNAVLIGLNSEVLSSMLSINNQSVQSHAHVFTKGGHLIVACKHENSISIGTNLFSWLEKYAEFDNDYSVETMRSDFANDESGLAVLNVDGETVYMFYSPIAGTEWYMTMLIPYSAMDATVGRLSNSLNRNAILLLSAVVVVMLIVFVLYYISMKKAYTEADMAREKAENASNAKSEFLSHMSHDIRTPINGIMGMNDIALKNLDNKEKVKYCLKKIEWSSQHLLSLINDVLDMSRIESGKTVIAYEAFNMNDVINKCTAIVSGQLISRDLKLICEFGDFEHQNLLGDELHLRQILINILGNAVKFTPDGGKIYFRVHESIFNGTSVLYRFEIEDTGIGMNPDFVSRIWEAFSQENNGSRTEYNGTGLGMSITKKFVDMMKGTIFVESVLNKGSKFVVSICFDLDTKVQSLSRQITETHDIKGMKLLLVEDNELNAEIAKCILEEDGAEVILAENGKIALDIFTESESHRFDAILMDIMMPVMDGIESAKAIRASAHPDGKSIPIVAMTANAYKEDIQNTKNAGMNAHISKPIDTKILLSILSELYAGSGDKE
jgi:signal transduction histidine kinase/CheY-like chemotaxis protein